MIFIVIFQLLKFEALCEDGVWGVRKACAECFMAVSWAVTREVRKTRLSPLFVKLLCDQSRWVSAALVGNGEAFVWLIQKFNPFPPIKCLGVPAK